MARLKKKETIILHARIEANLMREFQKFCEETGRTQTGAVEMLMREYLKNNYEEGKRK